jgi:hypothetical protein
VVADVCAAGAEDGDFVERFGARSEAAHVFCEVLLVCEFVDEMMVLVELRLQGIGSGGSTPKSSKG